MNPTPYAWNALPLQHERHLSADGRKLQESINRAIEDLIAARDKYEADVVKHNAAGLDNLTRKARENARDLADRKIELLRQELALRHRLRDQWYPARTAERIVASDKADQDCNKVTEDIVARLVGIGYIDGTTPDGFAGITPDMVHRHPAVHAAMAENTTTHGMINDTDDVRQNGQYIVYLESDLQDIARRLVAVA